MQLLLYYVRDAKHRVSTIAFFTNTELEVNRMFVSSSLEEQELRTITNALNTNTNFLITFFLFFFFFN